MPCQPPLNGYGFSPFLTGPSARRKSVLPDDLPQHSVGHFRYLHGKYVDLPCQPCGAVGAVAAAILMREREVEILAYRILEAPRIAFRSPAISEEEERAAAPQELAPFVDPCGLDPGERQPEDHCGGRSKGPSITHICLHPPTVARLPLGCSHMGSVGLSCSPLSLSSFRL